MADKKRLIPHWVWPSFWGLAGKTKDRAVAEYYLDGEDLELRMAEIDITEKDMLTIEKAEIKFKHGSITEKEHDYAIAKVRDDEGTWLGVKHKHGELSDKDFCKAMATLREEPWVDYVELTIDKETGNIVSFELEWNQYFIDAIKREGHVAPTDEGCVDLWFTQMSRNYALEELSGTGLFDEDSEESYALKKKRLDGGKSEYK